MKCHLCVLAAMLTIARCSVAQRALRHPEPKQPVFITDAKAESIPNFDLVSKQLREYHDCTCKCGCYPRDLDVQADRAIAILRRRVARSRSGEKLALVLDIDETSISNYQELIKENFVFDKAAFNAWAETAQAPAIPGTLRLVQQAERLGVGVFFISGRPESQLEITERNLRSQGFTGWQKLMLRPASTSAESVDAYKSSMRAQIVAQGYRLVLNVGDQWSDLKGKPEAEISVKYPDPFYFLP